MLRRNNPNIFVYPRNIGIWLGLAPRFTYKPIIHPLEQTAIFQELSAIIIIFSIHLKNNKR
ncbi:hypothetical protein BXY75_1673 [Ulvibacter antarcticus]|uniref:Uncharacterized protein n=1 Tax=Ulvibacter antarcticus TaxID=442714 RepID=A0A3L9ZDP7_9FLAO|nr:hypothetical protein BXY75_1673 [Ulvibacter antarcticus]